MIDRYTYRVIWSDEDGEYAGLCAEFPSLSWLAPTPDAARSGIRQLVAEVFTDLRDAGETPPNPDATPTDRSGNGGYRCRTQTPRKWTAALPDPSV